MQNSLPKFKIKTAPPTNNEKNLFGIFISHSNTPSKSNQGYLKDLLKKMHDNGLNPIFDREFLNGGVYFHSKIKDCIKSYACVIVVTKESLASDWVHYECGYFSHSGHPVIIWDPKKLLSVKTMDSDLFNVHLSQYLPALHTSDEVIEKLKTLSIYSDLFKNECLNLSVAKFRETFATNVSTAMVHVSSPYFNEKKDLFKDCKFSTLVVNFGMFYKDQGNGTHCWSKRTLDESGKYSISESSELNCQKCKLTDKKCTMFSDGNIDPSMTECIILNHVMPNGRYFDKGETDYDKQALDNGTLIFYVPVHKLYGTEFKFIVDAPTNAIHLELMRLFDDIGLNPTVSDSLNGWRIYLSIPEVPHQSFFRLNHLYNNNFLCPRAAVEEDKR